MRTSRRGWLTGMGAATLASGFGKLHAAQNDLPLQPVRDVSTGLELLKLPPGFTCESMSWTGDRMVTGEPVPPSHDAMAAFAQADGSVALLRNHETFIGAPVSRAGGPTYDALHIPSNDTGNGIPGLGGGVTKVTWAGFGKQPVTEPKLSGTIVNCAGGPTPWGSWLSCEEMILRGGSVGAQDHGYVYEVPVSGDADPQPIKGMGCFAHEAAAVDDEGTVYLTEDNGSNSGIYRYLPKDRTPAVGALAKGGELQMLKVVDTEGADLTEPVQGQAHQVEWVTIANPDADAEQYVPPAEGLQPMIGRGKSGPYLQGEAQGAARFSRCEGCWFRHGLVYWADTDAGEVHAGAIWAYDPKTQRLLAVYVSPDAREAEALDNITVSATGTILACEDNYGQRNEEGELVVATRLIAIQPNRPARVVAENNARIDAVKGRPAIKAADYRTSEFAGASYSPDGSTLFVNIQTPGITLAIRGPWQNV